jgi:hypothetical protein
MLLPGSSILAKVIFFIMSTFFVITRLTVDGNIIYQ